MDGAVRNGVQAFGHHRPIHSRVPALHDCGRLPIGGVDDCEALGGQCLAQALTADDEHGRPFGEVIAQ